MSLSYNYITEPSVEGMRLLNKESIHDLSFLGIINSIILLISCGFNLQFYFEYGLYILIITLILTASAEFNTIIAVYRSTWETWKRNDTMRIVGLAFTLLGAYCSLYFRLSITSAINANGIHQCINRLRRTYGGNQWQKSQQQKISCQKFCWLKHLCPPKILSRA